MSVDITLRAVKGTPLLNSEVDTNFTNLKTAIDAYTAADVLIKIKTVDGSGSGLDADTVEWFKENGGLTRANGEHFRNTLMSRGGSVDSMQMFRNFRGRDAQIEPLLRRRGLTQQA